MMKPKHRPRRPTIEREAEKDDDTRMETFERDTERRNDEAQTRPEPLDPETARLDIND